MRGRYRSSPVRLLNGGGEDDSKYGGDRENRRRARRRRSVIQVTLTLLLCLMVLIGCAMLLRGREEEGGGGGGGGGGVRYARRQSVFAFGNAKADSAVVTAAVTAITTNADARKRTRGLPSTILDDVETMLVSGELTLKKVTDSNHDGVYDDDNDDGTGEEDSDWEEKDVDELMKTYTFHDSKGNPLNLDEVQKKKLFGKLRESKVTKRKLSTKLATFVNTDVGGDTNLLGGGERHAANEETHVADNYQMRVHSKSDVQLADARASIVLPIKRTEASLAWTAILEDTSVHITNEHAKDGSLRSTASRDAYLHWTSALVLELLAADDAVMLEWAQEKVDEHSHSPHDVRMDIVHASEEEDASAASHGLGVGSRIGGLEVIQGEDGSNDESGDAVESRRHPGQASAGRFGGDTAYDVLHETMRREQANDGTIMQLADKIREASKSDMAGFYHTISSLGTLNHDLFGTPEYFATKWQRYISLTPSFDDRIFRGRGIVICGGGLRYIGSLWLTIKMLREQGSVLPIEIFGFGGEQPTPLLRKLFEDQNASFVSMDEIIPGGSTLFKGYELKIFAIVFSSFAEVLSLDSDNMPLVNVDELFLDQASGEAVDRYQPDRDGALFWPDFWSASVDSDLLLALGIDPVVNAWMGTHDSGQMLIQKRRGWDALMLATFMSLHADTIYPMLTRNGVGIGDKEVLPICFAALRIPAFKV